MVHTLKHKSERMLSDFFFSRTGRNYLKNDHYYAKITSVTALSCEGKKIHLLSLQCVLSVAI